MTNTTQKPYIFDPVSGEWFRIVDHRVNLRTDWILCRVALRPTKAVSGGVEPRHILEPCEAPPLPQSKEVVEVLEAAKEVAACRGIERGGGSSRWMMTDGVVMNDLRNRLAALPTPEPRERFYVDPKGIAIFVKDRDKHDNAIAQFDDGDDAKDFAAFKNSQEAKPCN